MKKNFYSSERNVQMLVYLLKKHNIKKIIASPGATNVCFIGSLQNDPFFEIYSAADERQAAYIACGLAAESKEPVVVSCTGATASRNYIPALTEAYYRKLPILAVTATQHIGRVGQNIAQVIDRSTIQNDIAKYSLHLPTIHDSEDEWAYGVKINEALLELRHRGGGPVHINLTTEYSKDFSVKELSPVKSIQRIAHSDEFPSLDNKRIAIFVGAHLEWDDALVSAVDCFCEKYNSVVLCDHTSNYPGKYGVFYSLVTSQVLYSSPLRNIDVLIDIGDVSGAYPSFLCKEVWRINPDGAIRDRFRKLTNVFEMEEFDFFSTYNLNDGEKNNTSYFYDWKNEIEHFESIIPELPFSNVWIAQNTISRLPKNSVLHLGILNSLRSWNLFSKDLSIRGYSNTGGFGIDGCLSSLIGASLAHKEKLFFAVVGDLAFFYDMNSLGNKHVGNNLRIMLINNGRGTEFRNYNHPAQICFEDDADDFMAAAGHYGNKSRDLVRHYSEDLGYEYICADDKQSFISNLDRFLEPCLTDKPIIFEVFTDSNFESEALEISYHLEKTAKGQAKETIKKILGKKGTEKIKMILKK